jgi:hypothetical protein
MTITLSHIYRYPVKGLSAQAMPCVELAAGCGLPEDRRFAIMHGASTFNPNEPSWQPKTSFLGLARNERLGTLETEYDDVTTLLTVRRGGRQVARGRIGTLVGRGLIEQFLAAYLKDEVPGVPRLVEAPGVMFGDTPEKWVSIVGAASLHDLERVVHEPVNPLRFRPNFIIAGAAPWEESHWVGRTLMLGPARLNVTVPITRYSAINVEPGTGAQTLNLLLALARGFGHQQCGVYAQVLTGGAVAVGDTAVLEPT